MANRVIPHSKPWITESEHLAVSRTLMSGMIAEGDLVRQFEKALAGYSQSSGAVVCSSGTAAMLLALKSLGIGPGDEVILPTYVCHSVEDVVETLGALPVLCDIGPNWVMEASNVAPLISKDTKAIIVAHVFGIAADTKTFLDFGVPVIEDLCQAFGAHSYAKDVGTGVLSVYSFQATKCLTTGEGGAVVSRDQQLIDRMLWLRENSYACRMTDLNAALGLAQLGRYDCFLERRRIIAAKYFDALPPYLMDQLRQVKDRTGFFRFPLYLPEQMEFEKAVQRFSGYEIAVRRGVDALLHRRQKLPDRDFPGAVRCFERTLSIPLYPALTNGECDRIVEAANDIFCR